CCQSCSNTATSITADNSSGLVYLPSFLCANVERTDSARSEGKSRIGKLPELDIGLYKRWDRARKEIGSNPAFVFTALESEPA
ncbi:hypothetical protein BaRGS_00033769, partial [Batillaria attramentaria]